MAVQYETVWEIFNQCPNNQMRDVFIDEIETEDVDAWVRRKFADREVRFEKVVDKNGTILYDIYATGIHERYSFTPID